MSLPQEQIAAISREVLHQFDVPLDLVGVVTSDGGSGRVEIMVTLRGCHDEPCRLVLNLPRVDSVGLAAALRTRLQDQLRAHVATRFVRSRNK